MPTFLDNCSRHLNSPVFEYFRSIQLRLVLSSFSVQVSLDPCEYFSCVKVLKKKCCLVKKRKKKEKEKGGKKWWESRLSHPAQRLSI